MFLGGGVSSLPTFADAKGLRYADVSIF
jgi:hypothetical protein